MKKRINKTNFVSWVVLAAIFFLIAFGCKSKQVVIDNSTHATDSVIITKTEKVDVIVKDTIIITDTAVVEYHDTIDCPNTKLKISNNSGNAKLSVNITNGKLTAKCKCDSLEVTVKNLRQINSYTNNELSKAKNNQIKETIEVPVIKYKFQYPWWWWLCLVYTIASLLYIFRKTIFKSLVKI